MSIIYSTEASFQYQLENLSEAWYRESKKIWKFRSHDTEKLPPYRNSRSEPNEARCWPSLLDEKWCLCNLSHGITLRTASYRSRKFYSTLMKDLIDDYNAMIARRPCHGSWILRVWSVNESSDSVAFHRRSQSKVVSGVSGRKYRYQLFKATVWHHTKRIHNSGQNNF